MSETESFFLFVIWIEHFEKKILTGEDGNRFTAGEMITSFKRASVFKRLFDNEISVRLPVDFDPAITKVCYVVSIVHSTVYEKYGCPTSGITQPVAIFESKVEAEQFAKELEKGRWRKHVGKSANATLQSVSITPLLIDNNHR